MTTITLSRTALLALTLSFGAGCSAESAADGVDEAAGAVARSDPREAAAYEARQKEARRPATDLIGAALTAKERIDIPTMTPDEGWKTALFVFLDKLPNHSQRDKVHADPTGLCFLEISLSPLKRWVDPRDTHVIEGIKEENGMVVVSFNDSQQPNGFVLKCCSWPSDELAERPGAELEVRYVDLKAMLASKFTLTEKR